MASFRKRNGRYQVQVRIKGSPPISRTFTAKADGQAWARKIEAEAERCGLPADRKVLDRVTVGEIIQRYGATVTPTKRGAVREAVAIRVLLRDSIAKVPLSALTIARVAAFQDSRLRTVKPGSIKRELAIYRHAFETARKCWGIPLPENPFALVTKPRVSDARSRRLEDGEWERLRMACEPLRNPYVFPMIEFALETAMRRGEVLRVKRRDIDWHKRTLHIPQTKNGHARTIPLTERALRILTECGSKVTTDDLPIFATTEDAVKFAWRRIIRRARLANLRYHDLRHEAISRFFEYGLSVPEVALISGHRDYRMLGRYTHLRPENIAEKLAKLGSPSEFQP